MDLNIEELLRASDPAQEFPADFEPTVLPSSPTSKSGSLKVLTARHRSKVGARNHVGIGIAVGVAGVSMIVLAGLFVIGAPTGTDTPQSASAAELHQIALRVTNPPSLPPPVGTAVEESFSVSLQNQSNSTGVAPSVAAETDSLAGTFSTWVTESTECEGAIFNSVSHSGAQASAAWMAAGLADTPRGSQVLGVCNAISPLAAGNTNSQLSDGFVPIDVSGLPEDASQLASELESGTTGIANLDQGIPQIDGSSAGFSRAVLLLIAPLVGDSAQFRSDLFNAIAQLPGVRSLGTETSHSGAQGTGFSVDSGPTAESAIIDPNTGQLVEVKNFQYGGWGKLWLDLVLSSFDSSQSALYQEYVPPISDELHLSADWLDVTSVPSQVDASSIPALTLTVSNAG